MSFEQDGHFMIFFCALNVRLPSQFLSFMKVWPAKVSCKHDLQKLCAQGVVRGRFITLWQIRQQNSAVENTFTKSTFEIFIKIYEN